MKNISINQLYCSGLGLLLIILTLSACNNDGRNNNSASVVSFLSQPIMSCQVLFANGSFFGYQPPQRGDFLRVNLAQLSKLKKLQFDSKKGSYIPLFDPFQIEKVTSISETELIDLRLVSDSHKGNRIFLDIHRYNSFRSVQSKVWIVQENQVIRSVILMDCTFTANKN